MDDELRDAERKARERGDAASTLAWAASLRRAGRDIEAAAAAFLARARGASRDEVFPLAQAREGGGDALAPWPNPRGDSAGTRRSRVEGPTARARVLFEIDLGAEDVAWGHGPIVLADGSLVVALDRTERGGSYVKAFSKDGEPLWTVGLRENLSPPVALASGEIAVASARDLILLAVDGRELLRVPVVAPVAASEVVTWFLPAAWNRSLVIGDKVIGQDGRVSELRGAGGRRLRVRSAIATPGGLCLLAGKAYGFEKSGLPGSAPPIFVDPIAVHAFGREGEFRWSAPLAGESTHVVAAREQFFTFANGELVARNLRDGASVGTRPFGGPYIALDPADEPIAAAPFGPPLIGAPVVDAAGRRYAATARGDLVGLGADSTPLFAAPLELTAERLTGSLALAAGRLYLLVLRPGRRTIVCFGDG